MEEKKIQEKKSKQQKKIEDKEKALEMRAAALSGMSSKYTQFLIVSLMTVLISLYTYFEIIIYMLPHLNDAFISKHYYN